MWTPTLGLQPPATTSAVERRSSPRAKPHPCASRRPRAAGRRQIASSTGSRHGASRAPKRQRFSATLSRNWRYGYAPIGPTRHLFVRANNLQLDLCDPRQSFETIVPQRAGSCPVLLNAIFTLSARHMSHVTDSRNPESHRLYQQSLEYHDRCLKELGAEHNDPKSWLDPDLFAATIILRVFEEMGGTCCVGWRVCDSCPDVLSRQATCDRDWGRGP